MAKVRYFDFDTSKLSKSEVIILEKLKEAGEIIHSIWEKQIDQNTGRILVYPHDASREEILEVAKKDPELLSGCTVVKRTSDGSLKAIPYTEEYADELKLFHDKMMEVHDATDDPDLKIYIRKLLTSCMQGDYRSALIAYLENPNTKIEFMVGPIETYEDDILGRKKTFQFNLRVLKDDVTDEVLQMVDVMRDIRLLQPKSSSGASITSDKIKVRIDDVVMFAGRQAGHLVSSTNLPNDEDMVEQYGTKIVVYTTSMNLKFDQMHVPLLNHIANLDLHDKVDEMKSAMFRWIALHEIAEGTVKFKRMDLRLGSAYAYMRELNAHLVGLDSAKYHVLNGIITPEQYQYLLSAMIIFALDLCNKYKESKSLVDYAKGFAVMLNRFEETGALSLTNGKIELDFQKMSATIEFLADLTLNILEKGSERDAIRLLETYGSFDIFDRLPK